jgi:proline iminopeptidase
MFFSCMVVRCRSSVFEGFEDFLPRNDIEFYYRAYGRSHGTPMKWKQFAKVSVWINSICWDTQGAGLLAIEYALKYQEHLKGLVISNMAASADSFVKHVSKLRAQFPADVRAKLEFYENADKTDDPAYQRLLFDKVYKIFICRDL